MVNYLFQIKVHCEEVIVKDVWSDFSIKYFFTHTHSPISYGEKSPVTLLNIYKYLSEFFQTLCTLSYQLKTYWWWFKTTEIKIEKVDILWFLVNLPLQYVDFP